MRSASARTSQPRRWLAVIALVVAGMTAIGCGSGDPSSVATVVDRAELLELLSSSGLKIDYVNAPETEGADQTVAGTAVDRTGRKVAFEVAFFPQGASPTSDSLTYLNTVQRRKPDDLAPGIGTLGNIAYGRVPLKRGDSGRAWTTEQLLDDAIFASFGEDNPETTARFTNP